MAVYTWWTEDRVGLLKKLWDEGISAGHIGLRMGCTRNAVLGKVDRLGLPRRQTTYRLAGAFAQRRRRQKERREEAKKAFARKKSRIEELLQADGFVPKDDDVFIPVETRKTIETLTDHCCRWPVGDPLEKDFYFCGQARVPGLPYCLSHTRKAYIIPAPKKKKSDNVVPLHAKFEEVV